MADAQTDFESDVQTSTDEDTPYPLRQRKFSSFPFLIVFYRSPTL